MANCGSYMLVIKGQQLQKVLQANNGDTYQSPMFNMAGLKWRIEYQPNGKDSTNKGSFNVYLRLIELPFHFEFILVQRRTECIKTLTSATSIYKYEHNTMNWRWNNDTMRIEEIKNLKTNQISIKINMKILKIHSIKNELLFSDLLSVESA
eukprot:160894_1